LLIRAAKRKHHRLPVASGRLQDGRGKLFRAKSIGKGGIWYEDVRMNDWLRPKTFVIGRRTA
jgi:hypothetical protein